MYLLLISMFDLQWDSNHLYILLRRVLFIGNSMPEEQYMQFDGLLQQMRTRGERIVITDLH